MRKQLLDDRAAQALGTAGDDGAVALQIPVGREAAGSDEECGERGDHLAESVVSPAFFSCCNLAAAQIATHEV